MTAPLKTVEGTTDTAPATDGEEVTA